MPTMETVQSTGLDTKNEAFGIADAATAPANARSTTHTHGSRPNQIAGRRPKACHECRKLKIRCDVFPGDRKCRHCLRRNIDCIINLSYTTRVQDISSKEEPFLITHDKIDAIQQGIQDLKDKLDSVLNQPAGLSTHADSAQIKQALLGGITQDALPVPAQAVPSYDLPWGKEENTRMAMTRENSPEAATDADGNEPVTLEEPMGSLYEVTRLRNIRSNKAKTTRSARGNKSEVNDFITRGILSEEEAEQLYDVFLNTLNHYLWVGLEQIHSSLTSVRQSSELLTATIMTVTALHLPNSTSTFDACYKEFLSLISSSMFSRYHAIDDVRGLCIAAFWLSEVSWKLSGHAIRIATELNIHRSFSRALRGDREHFLRARLWYMLYVCDHHFSIAYGRPPTISESIQIREHERFIAGPNPDVLDIRILSQVHLMQILSSVYQRFSLSEINDIQLGGSFGSSTYGSSATSDAATAVLDEVDLEILSDYNSQIDQWRKRWYPRQPPSPFIGEFTNRGVVLYSYFAKLQVNSLAVRGISSSYGRLSMERRELANVAVSAAVSILTMVLEEEGIRKSLVGTPLYVHTMITFASVFLMKSTTKWARLMGLNIEYAFVSKLLRKVITLLKTAVTSERHLIKHIAVGLERLLGRLVNVGLGERTIDLDDSDIGMGKTPSIALIPSSHSPSSDDRTRASVGEQGGPGLSNTVQSQQPQIDPMDGMGGWVVSTDRIPPAEAAADEVSANPSAFLTNDLMYQVFGSDSTNNVYHLLSTQFQ